MKKRKILYLFPLAALVLSGCTFQEGWDTFSSWVSDHIFSPIASLFNGGKKENSGKKDDSGKTTPADTPSGDTDPEADVAETVGSLENPISISEFIALCDENLKFSDIAGQTKGQTSDFTHIVYLTGTCNGHEAMGQYDIYRLWLKDESGNEVTVMNSVPAESVTASFATQNAQKGNTIIVKGYPALFTKDGTEAAKQYEVVKKDNNTKPAILKVTEPGGTPGVNYGTLENPISVSQAKAIMDSESPTKAKIYVTGTVTSNDAWTTGTTSGGKQYANVGNIWITDGQTSITVFRCENFPSDIVKENIKANQFIGQTVVASGTGELYQKDASSAIVPELGSSTVHSITGEVTPPTPVDNFGTLDNPLSITEAKAVIDAQNPTTQEMYVTGTVESNTAWNTGTNSSGVAYANMDIVLKDGENKFTLYRVETLPSEYDTVKPTKDSLVDKIIVAHGTGKLYNSTYELAQGCVVDKIEDAAPIEVQYVQLSQQSIEMEVGQHVDLNAYVFPNNASQDVEWSIQQTGEVVSFENNVVSGLAVGTATITATSVADPTKSASCTVTVSEATKTLTGITVDTTNAKHNYEEGDDYSAEGLVVTAHYSDAPDEQVVAGVTWEFDPVKATLGDESVTITAHYNEESSVNVISVTVSEKVAEKGTLENPYSVSEAYVIYQGLASGDDNGKSVYVEGYINANPAPSIGSNRGNFYLTDGVCAVDAYAYGINNVGNTQDVTLADIPVGGRALVQCAIKNYGGTFELCFVSNVSNGCLAKAVETPVLTSVGQPVGPAEVSVGGSIDPSQVTVPVVYSNIVNAEIHPTSVSGDFSTAGKATVTVVVDGWEDTVSFDVTVVSGTVLVETEVYKLDGTVTGGSSGYAEASEITQGGVVWSVEGNTTINPWRIGGKNLSGVDRTAKSTQAVTSDDLTKVVVTTGTKTLSAVNSITIKVGSAEGASDLGSKEFTTNLVSASLEFARPNGQTWTNAFITVVFNVNAAGSNQYIQLTSISLYAMK